jgi:hypothetical protein
MAADLRHPACIALQKDRMVWEINYETSNLEPCAKPNITKSLDKTIHPG